MTTSMRNVLATTTAVALAALLASCAPAAPAASPASGSPDAASADPQAPDPASATVLEYLDAIALGNVDGAWKLLSAETQATYNDSAQTYAEYAPHNESITAAGARALAETDFAVTPGPQDAYQLVSARSGDLADAWVVRESGTGLRIDDPGIPPTGERPFSWTNPDDAAYDTTQPPTIYFQKTYADDDELLVDVPESIVGYADGAAVPVTRNASAGSGADFVAEVPDGTVVLTVVWAPDADSPLWHSSTVTLD